LAPLESGADAAVGAEDSGDDPLHAFTPEHWLAHTPARAPAVTVEGHVTRERLDERRN
jgi:hypothetical protein